MEKKREEYKSAAEIRNEIANLKIQLAFQEQFEEEVNEILNECQKNSPNRIKSSCKNKMRRIGKMTRYEILRRMAVLSVIFSLAGGTVALATTLMPETSFFELDIKTTLSCTSFHLKQTAEWNVPEQWEGYYYPTFIPTGFELVPEYAHSCRVIYMNDNNDWISFSEYTSGAGVSIDTENAQISNRKINGESAIIIEKGNFSAIVWNVGKHFFLLDIVGDKETAIRVAESVTMIR